MTPPSLIRRGLTTNGSTRRVGGIRDRQLREPETAFQNKVLELAQLYRWRVHHMHDSRKQEWGTDSGWPDLVLCKPPRLLFVELKVPDGRLTKEQSAWLRDLQACGVEAYVWRPTDLIEIGRVLSTTTHREARPNQCPCHQRPPHHPPEDEWLVSS